MITIDERRAVWLMAKAEVKAENAAIRERENAVAAERERCANIALALDSGRGNEKEIAAAIRRGIAGTR